MNKLLAHGRARLPKHLQALSEPELDVLLLQLRALAEIVYDSLAEGLDVTEAMMSADSAMLPFLSEPEWWWTTAFVPPPVPVPPCWNSARHLPWTPENVDLGLPQWTDGRLSTGHRNEFEFAKQTGGRRLLDVRMPREVHQKSQPNKAGCGQVVDDRSAIYNV
jgi:hypothetical protein